MRLRLCRSGLLCSVDVMAVPRAIIFEKTACVAISVFELRTLASHIEFGSVEGQKTQERKKKRVLVKTLKCARS